MKTKAAILQVVIVFVPDISLADISSVIYWTNHNTNKIQRANLDGSNVIDVITAGVDNSWGIAIDSTNKIIYWTNRDTNKIKAAELDGSNPVDIVVENITTPNGISYDYERNTIFWTSFGGKIQSSFLNGSGTVNDIITDILYGRPMDIAIDYGHEKIYFSFAGIDFGMSCIVCADIDGTNIQSLPIDFPMFTAPGGIALDIVNDKIYWTEATRIRRANLNGSNVEDLVTGLSFATDIILDLDNNLMYWSDWRANKIQSSELNGYHCQDIITGLDGPVSIALYNVPEPASLLLLTTECVYLLRRKKMPRRRGKNSNRLESCES